jgi:glycosyltransferase involved in cell wall biosynthesis
MTDSLFTGNLPRVLLAGHLPPPMSGIGSYYQTLLNSSLPRRINLRFIDTSLRRRPGSETGKWSFSNLMSAIGDCLRFTRAVIIYRPQICHIATSVGLSFLKHSVCVVIARVLGRKVLLHPHCSFYFFYERQGKVWQWFVRKVVGLCQGVVVLSHEWNKLQQVVPGCQTHYLPNAIDLSSYTDIGREKVESKNDTACAHILYLGHIGKEKGSFDLINAAKKILTQQKDVVFELAGMEQVKGDIEQLNSQIVAAGFEQFIHICLHVVGPEKMQLFRSADIFVYPSYHEGMPIAVIEAMACGLPIVATQVGGLPDLVYPHVNGLLVAAGEPDQLANAIQELVLDPQMRHSMQIGSLRLAQENFDVEKLVLRLVDVYQTLVPPDQKISIHPE